MYALIDCNNFFASCEEVFDLRLKNRPLVILSNNDGCVISRSKKAKEMHVKMGQPVYELKSTIEKGIILARSSNFSLYADMSQRVMQTLFSFSLPMEIYSIDEAFLFIEKSDTQQELIDLGYEIKKKVKRWTGIPISVGIAPTQTLAKVANHNAKKEDGVSVLFDTEQIRLSLEKTPLKQIWGIGSRSVKRLNRAKIFTVKQLVEEQDEKIRKILGTTGLRTTFELRGVCCHQFDKPLEPRKSLVYSRSFGKAVQDLKDLESAIAFFITKAAEKLRKEHLKAKFLSVFIHTSFFQNNPYSNQSNIVFPFHTAYTPELIFFAKKGLRQIFRSGFSYKKGGILLADFIEGEDQQLDLLQKNLDNDKKKRLMQTIDQINATYDKPAIYFAAEGLQKNWKSIRANVSKRYTTSWDELLTVK